VSLADALAVAWKPQAVAIAPVRLNQANSVLSQAWADSRPHVPEPFELGQIVDRISTVWRLQGSLASLLPVDRRWLPYSFFHPHGDRHQWLAADEDFISEALIEIERVPRMIVAALRQALLRYPQDLDSFRRLRGSLAEMLFRVNSPRLPEWRRRATTYRLLEEDGPHHIARLIQANEMSGTEILKDAGLDDELGSGEFVRLITHALLKKLRDEGDARPEASALLRPFEFLAPNSRLRFPSDAHLVANALLLPYVAQSPRASARQQIERFLLTHLKDPRFERGAWQRVSQNAEAVLRRWIIGATLKDFFRLISRNALEKHWKYREAFWSAYLKKEMIGDAWVVLGEEARAAARRIWKEVPPYGILHGSGDSAHCVLLLKIGSLTVAEWSHNGKCRIWCDGNELAPNFYERLYLKAQLRDGADEELIHMASDYYTWQGKLASLIRSETGCEVWQRDYGL
jgi:hypothetical protein